MNAAVLRDPRMMRPSAFSRLMRAAGETLSGWRDLFDDVVWIALIATLAFLALASAPDAGKTLQALADQFLPQVSIQLDR